MTAIHVLLVENEASIKASLELSLGSIESESFSIDTVTSRQAEGSFHLAKRANDVILFSEKIPPGTVFRLAQAYHKQGNTGHLIMLTKQSEPRLSPLMKKNGIDDILNVMEIETPVFAWTFTSSIQQVGIKKKAREYEVIQQRLHLVNNALEHISSSMNMPLANLRGLAAQVGKEGGMKAEKSAAVHQLLIENVEVLEHFRAELLDVRDRLAKETKVINKFLAVKSRM